MRLPPPNHAVNTDGHRRRGAPWLFAILIPGIAWPAGLDAPVKPSVPTVRSEIYRGRTATDVCPPSNARVINECADRLQSQAITDRTTSDPFALGVFYNAALLAAVDAKVTGSPASNEIALRILRKVKALRDKLGLTEDQVCEAAQIHDCNVPREIIRGISAAR